MHTSIYHHLSTHINESCYKGMVTGRDVRVALLEPEAVSLLNVGELLRTDVPTVGPNETLDVVIDKFSRNDMESLPVAALHDATRIQGLITRHAVMRRYQEELEKQV